MRAYVIILNWNGWKDTIECLESVLRLDYPHLQILVCDNASSDDSIEKIKSWARGELIAGCPNPQLSHLTSPPVNKPLSLLHLSRHQAESEGVHRDAQIVLIQTGANLGFAGGNNVGMRYALQDQECKYLWLLNNDTIVTNAALSALIQKANENDRTGAVSSICYFADAPSIVESWAGAHVNLWIGYARNSIEPRHDRWFDALYGASMLIARPAIEDCGLLDEGFFLYWDETEFCVRLRKKGWRLAAAPASQVFHKVNASTGGNKLIIDRYFTASGLRILRLHAKSPFISMTIFLAVRFIRRTLKLQFTRLASVWQGMKDYARMLPIVQRIR